jgi:hypothetical protein
MYMTRGTVATDVACSCSVTSRKGYKTLLIGAQCYKTFYGRNLPLGAVVAKWKSVGKLINVNIPGLFPGPSPMLQNFYGRNFQILVLS